MDQIYAPVIDAFIWTHDTLHSFLPPKGVSEYDHTALQITLTLARGARGSDLQTIKKKITLSDPLLTRVPKGTRAILVVSPESNPLARAPHNS